jgi:hypothetical protein
VGFAPALLALRLKKSFQVIIKNTGSFFEAPIWGFVD